MRRARSPDAPKMTRAQDSAPPSFGPASPPSFGPASAMALASIALDGVTPELLPQSRYELRPERVLLTRAEAGEEGVSEDGGGDIERSEEHTSELQSRLPLVCRLLL